VTQYRKLLLPLITTMTLAGPALADGDAGIGGKLYRACLACHSLQTGVHLSGPSLAGIWGAKAGKNTGFVRYSPGLKAADFSWDEDTLNAWLANPDAMISGTTMKFRGIAQNGKRADLIAFLRLAMVPGGSGDVVAKGLVTESFIQGQQPPNMQPTPKHKQITNIRHCGNAYFVENGNGDKTSHWEKNIRLKIDSQATGPAPGTPVIHGAGMRGDRFSVIFSSLDELKNTLKEKC